jgi:DNA-directed RNA polymerase specialized sigma subunit
MYYLEDKNMKDIGRLFGLSESRISQLINKLKKNIRKKNEKFISDYPDLCC